MNATAPRTRRPYRTLVLNADYTPLTSWPISVVPAQEALATVLRGRADVVETWDDAFYRSPSQAIAVPKVVALRQYANIHASPKFCRRSILLRDGFRCQYCGDQFPAAELTYDHVIPRAAGGRTTWDNILSACVDCNAKKRNLPAAWSGRKGAGMRPLKMPRQPTAAELMRAGMRHIEREVVEDFSEWLYWGVSLEP